MRVGNGLYYVPTVKKRKSTMKYVLKLCAVEGCCAKEFRKSGWCRAHYGVCACGKRIGHDSARCIQCHNRATVKIGKLKPRPPQTNQERKKEILLLIAGYRNAIKTKRIVTKQYAQMRITALRAKLHER